MLNSRKKELEPVSPCEQRTGITFAKIIPSGNPTIILFEDEIQKIALPTLATEVMQSNHLYAEQVGYLSCNDKVPHLQMMGGEFCVNATRSAVALIAHLGKPVTFDSSCNYGLVDITVSGYPSTITSIFSFDENILLQKIFLSHCMISQDKKISKEETVSLQSPYIGKSQFYVASRIEVPHVSIKKLEQGIFLVKLPGITHLLLDESHHKLPHDWRGESKIWSSRYELDQEIAYGIIWFKQKEDECSIHPAVFVPKAQSAHMETACGSGSLALALMLRNVENKKCRIKIQQPSGDSLSVLFSSDFEAWIAGNVSIVATGTTYISNS